MKELREFFRELDEDGDGFISVDRLVGAMGMTDEDADKMIREWQGGGASSAMWCPCGAHILFDADPCSENSYSMGDLGRGALYAPSAVVTKNLRFAAPLKQEMRSGTKIIRDAHCSACGQQLGWKYDEGLPDQTGNICLSVDILHINYDEFVKMMSWVLRQVA